MKTWGSSYAGEALCYPPSSTRILKSAICILFLERVVGENYPQLFPKFIFFQLIFDIFFNLLCILTYCINIVVFTPPPISIFEFEIPHCPYIIKLLFTLRYPTNDATLIFEGISTNICTRSGHISASIIFTPFYLHNSRRIAPISRPFISKIVFLRYLGATTV